MEENDNFSHSIWGKKKKPNPVKFNEIITTSSRSRLLRHLFPSASLSFPAAEGLLCKVTCLIDSALQLMFTLLYSSCSDGCDVPPGCSEADRGCEGDQTDDSVFVLQSQ